MLKWFGNRDNERGKYNKKVVRVENERDEEKEEIKLEIEGWSK